MARQPVRAATSLLGRRATSLENRHLSAALSSFLPAFGTAADDMKSCLQARKYMIAPYDSRYRRWQMLLIILAIYSTWASPFEIAFQKAESSSLLYVDLVVDVFFAVDIMISFFAAYLDSSTYILVDDRKKIATRYATSPWFMMDFVSTLPFQFMHKVISGRKHGGTFLGYVELLN